MSTIEPPRGGGEWASLQTPPAKEVAPLPDIGSKAPSSEKLPFPDGKLTIVVFLRHCGCPFAEKTFRQVATLSSQHPNIHFIAISHSSPSATIDRWIPQVGGTWDVEVVIDESRDLYAQWGLGLSSAWASIGPTVLWSAYKLGVGEGIWNRPTESGSRWQRGGAFAVDRFGSVKWVHACRSADDLPDFKAGLESLEHM